MQRKAAQPPPPPHTRTRTHASHPYSGWQHLRSLRKCAHRDWTRGRKERERARTQRATHVHTDRGEIRERRDGGDDDGAPILTREHLKRAPTVETETSRPATTDHRRRRGAPLLPVLHRRRLVLFCEFFVLRRECSTTATIALRRRSWARDEAWRRDGPVRPAEFGARTRLAPIRGPAPLGLRSWWRNKSSEQFSRIRRRRRVRDWPVIYRRWCDRAWICSHERHFRTLPSV